MTQNLTAQLPIAPHTRVTFQYAVDGYEPQETQGVVLEGSTLSVAKVSVLGLAKHKTIGLPWSYLTKVEHRCFTAKVEDGVMVITEVEPKNSHPMNWSGLSEYSRAGAWARAQARGLQTVFVSREGERKDLGRVFDPRAFERAAWSGYAAYGQSMSDFYYAPEKFESWVKSFRKHPAEHLNNQNDVSEDVKAALPLYLEALKAAGLA